MSPRRRKELQRQRRRLEEFAPVTFSSVSAPQPVAAALEDFLVLEASGWKGLAQTAAANDPAVRRFVEIAVTSLAAQGQARIDRMQLGGQAVAVAITLKSGETAWFWKIAYNEGVARFSPGVQLVHELTPELAAQPGMAQVDSCATAGHPMMDHMWHGRLALADRLIAVKRTALPFGLIGRLETLRRAALSAAKALRGRLRGGRAETPSGPGAQQPADHLAGRGHRHLRDEGDLARILVRGQPRAHEALDVGGKRVGRGDAGFQHDERLDDLGAHRIGLADHRGERHRRMLDQAILDLAGPDAVARRGDDVVVAADEREVAVVVDHALVAGGHPVADEFLARGLRACPSIRGTSPGRAA